MQPTPLHAEGRACIDILGDIAKHELQIIDTRLRATDPESLDFVVRVGRRSITERSFRLLHGFAERIHA
jgi:hypothetical protein